MKKMKLISIVILLIFYFSSSLAYGQIAIAKYVKASPSDLAALNELKEKYKSLMIYNKNLDSYFSFTDFVFGDNWEIKSYRIYQVKGVYLIQFVNDAITSADKMNGVQKSLTFDMRIPARRRMIVDKFPGKPPIVQINQWIVEDNYPLTPSMKLISGKWVYDNMPAPFMQEKDNFAIEIDKISEFRKLNLLQSCKNDECIIYSLNQFN